MNASIEAGEAHSVLSIGNVIESNIFIAPVVLVGPILRILKPGVFREGRVICTHITS